MRLLTHVRSKDSHGLHKKDARVNDVSLCAVNDTFVSVIPESPGEPCAQPDKMCDFSPDCEDGQDEAKCGE